MKRILIMACMLLGFATAKAQQHNTDSVQTAQALRELLAICKQVDFSDPKTQSVGTFYKAGPYIVYRGNDEKRKWKDTANYANADERKQVDDICFRINGSVNQDANYTITGYRQEKESEGVWHALMVSYTKKGRNHNAAFAFLKVKGRFVLGDID